MVSRMYPDRASDSDVSSASTYSIRDHEISVPGGTIVVRAITPTAPDGTDFPVLVYLHGGGAQYPSICFGTMRTTVYCNRLGEWKHPRGREEAHTIGCSTWTGYC